MPLRVEACPKLFDQLRLRDAHFEAFRGKAFLRTKDLSADLSMVMYSPHFLRAEVIGPMGVRVALLNFNRDWVQLYLPRENELFRLPQSEFKKSSARREAFLRLLPVPVIPEMVPDFLSTHVGLSKEANISLGCFYSIQDNAYIVRESGGKMGRLIWLDPTTLSPLQQWVFKSFTPRPDADLSSAEPSLVLKYSQPVGQGYATLRRKIELSRGRDLATFLTLQWESAESWPNPLESVFDWSAPASSSVKEY